VPASRRNSPAGNTGADNWLRKRIISASSCEPHQKRRRAAGEKLRTFFGSGRYFEACDSTSSRRNRTCSCRRATFQQPKFSNPNPCSHPNPNILPPGVSFGNPACHSRVLLRGENAHGRRHWRAFSARKITFRITTVYPVIQALLFQIGFWKAAGSQSRIEVETVVDLRLGSATTTPTNGTPGGMNGSDAASRVVP